MIQIEIFRDAVESFNGRSFTKEELKERVLQNNNWNDDGNRFDSYFTKQIYQNGYHNGNCCITKLDCRDDMYQENKDNNLNSQVVTFRKGWKSSGGNTKFLDNYNKNIKLYGVYKAAAISSVGASNQRALKLCGNKNLSKAKEECFGLIAKELESLFKAPDKSLKHFEKWEKNLADEIRNIHRRKYNIADYTYGNAQKWINLAIKYVFWYACDPDASISFKNEVFKNCYFPIDGIIQNVLHTESKGKIQKLGSWSACDDWEKIVNYEMKSREYIIEEGWYSPLLWEVSHW